MCLWQIIEKILPQRYVACILSTAGMMATCIANHCFRVALEQMVFPIYESQPFDPEFVYSGHMNQMIPPSLYAKFYWDSSVVRAIRQSYNIGYTVSLMPAGLLADLYGARYVWGAGLSLACIISLVLPFLAHIGPYALIAGLLMVGFGQGVSVPCSGVVIAQWAKPYELCLYTVIIHLGNVFGWLTVYFFSSDISNVFGWQGLLYFGAFVQVIFSIIWFSFYHNNPSYEYCSPPPINSDLHRTLMQRILIKMIRIRQSPPWKCIFLSRPVLALLLLNFLSGWTLISLFGLLKFYFRNVISIPAKDAWMVSGAALFAIVPSTLLHAIAVDLLVVKGLMSCTVSRRSFNVICNFLLMILLQCMIRWSIGSDYGIVLTFLSILYVWGINIGTLYANPVDLSPRHVGVVTALSQVSHTIGSMINKEFLQTIIEPKSKELSSWNQLIWATSGLLMILSIPYLMFGSGNVQYWNELPLVGTFSSGESEPNSETKK